MLDEAKPSYVTHVHKWSVDHQLIETDDGPPQPRGECFAYCGCGKELRCHEIQDYLNRTEPLDEFARYLTACWHDWRNDPLRVFRLGRLYEVMTNAFIALMLKGGVPLSSGNDQRTDDVTTSNRTTP